MVATQRLLEIILRTWTNATVTLMDIRCRSSMARAGAGLRRARPARAGRRTCRSDHADAAPMRYPDTTKMFPDRRLEFPCSELYRTASKAAVLQGLLASRVTHNRPARHVSLYFSLLAGYQPTRDGFARACQHNHAKSLIYKDFYRNSAAALSPANPRLFGDDPMTTNRSDAHGPGSALP